MLWSKILPFLSTNKNLSLSQTISRALEFIEAEYLQNFSVAELAKHVDTDKNKKCDKCGADIAVEEVTTTTAATEEKKGCGGTVSVAGLALVAALGSCALFVEKKRK